jgi:membrane protein DedA with SNARE-associated domain
MAESIFEILRNALVQYGYWALALTLLLENAGIPLPGETILLLASFLAYSEKRLSLPWIIVVATVAATIGDNIGFWIGYYGGRPLLERYQSIFRIRKKTLMRAEELFARHGATTVLFARFVFGLRIIAGPLAGVLRMPWRKFLPCNFIGAAVWVTVISCVGYLFGEHWDRLEHLVKHINLILGIVVILAIAFWWWRSRKED